MVGVQIDDAILSFGLIELKERERKRVIPCIFEVGIGPDGGGYLVGVLAFDGELGWA